MRFIEYIELDYLLTVQDSLFGHNDNITGKQVVNSFLDEVAFSCETMSLSTAWNLRKSIKPVA